MPVISKVVGEGTYGCVLKPSVKCKNKSKQTYKNRVSKVMRTKNAKIELDEYKAIKKADKKEEFYLGKPTTCKIGDDDETMDSIDKCKIAVDIYRNVDDYSLIIMKDGGKDLKQYIDEVAKRDTTPANKEKVERFLVEAHRLFMGLLVLKQNKLIHHDLKPQNFVYDEETNRINLIDFGLMKTKQAVSSQSHLSNNHLAHIHWSFPWEIMFLNHDDYNRVARMSNSDKNTYFNNKFLYPINSNSNDKISKTIIYYLTYVIDPNRSDKGHVTASMFLTNFFKTIAQVIQPGEYDTFAEKCIDTIDSYGLGFTMMHAVISLREFISDDLRIEMSSIFLDMINPRLDNRIRIEDAINRYELVLEKYGLLSKFNKYFENNKMKNMNEHDGITIPEGIDGKIHDPSNLSIPALEPAPCPPGIKELNPKTRRCIKVCKPGYERNDKFNCVKKKRTKEPKQTNYPTATSFQRITPLRNCPPGIKELNPKTRRCVNVCKPGYKRSVTFKCVKDAPATTRISPKNKCPPGIKEVNPKTGRCIKVCKPGYGRDTDFNCKKSPQ
jgi:serine/threonine protein kinase